MPLSAVPPSAPLMPALLRDPKAAVVDSSDRPKAFAVAPTTLSPPPSWEILVLVSAAPAARTFATRPESVAARLNCDMVLVIISPAEARSMPPAAAMVRVSFRPAVACWESQPAPAM